MSPGILVYGYDKNQAEQIQESITIALKKTIFLKSAFDKESELIESLIKADNNNMFEDNKTKIIMFIDMIDSEVRTVLNSFPKNIQRPIFCGLTEHNISWPFKELKEHLLEEQAFWKQQKPQNE